MKRVRAIALVLALVLVLAACGGQTTGNTDTKGAEITLHRGYGAPHGDKAFGRVVVAMNGDKILAVSLDEFQYLAKEGNTGVPNSDKGFGEGAKAEVVLASKVVNSATYSENMKKAKSTVTIADNFKAIETFAVGKTVAELEKVANDNEAGKPVDAVTGATLVDTVGYLKLIAETAKSTTFVTKGSATDASKVKLGAAQFAAHGEKAVADVVTAVEGDKVVATSIDEFQYTAGTGVPSSDGAFGENYADAAKPLVSKLQNAEAYSKNMAEKGKSTVSYDKNLVAIQDFAAGKTIADVEKVTTDNEAGKPVDAVTGATLVDTVGYLSAVVAAAKAAK